MCLAKRPGSGEGAGERLEQKIPEAERGPDDDVRVIELSSDKTAVIPPVEQAVAASLGDAVELSEEAADVGERHRSARQGRRPTTALTLTRSR